MGNALQEATVINVLLRFREDPWGLDQMEIEIHHIQDFQHIVQKHESVELEKAAVLDATSCISSFLNPSLIFINSHQKL